VAVAVHVYVLPFVNPVTLMPLAAPDAEPVAPPSLDVHVAVYDVMGLPPSLAGAVKQVAAPSGF